jgi:hypothetical protein
MTISFGDILYNKNPIKGKMMKKSFWKVIKYDIHNRTYELAQLHPKTGQIIPDISSLCINAKELETLIKYNEIEKV